jgi:PAS domain S-box-containing protein
VRALFVEGRPYGPFELALAEGVWVATALPIATGRGEPVAALVVARSKTAELAAFEGIRRGISVVGLAIFLISFPLSFLLARRASRPIEELAEAAAAIGSGRAPDRLPRSRWKEVGALTRAFGSMIEELAHRDAERRRAEAVTAGWKNRYEAAVLASGQILYDWEPETNAVTFGGSTERILGEPPSEITGGRAEWEARVHPDDLAAFRAETARVVETKDPLHLEYRIRRADGEYVCVRDEGFFVRQSAGERPRVVGFVVDVTQERRLEEHVRQSQRIEAVGRLAGGVAHDFNNLLTVIQGTASVLLARCGPGDELLKEDVTEILRASERATMLTRQLLAFSRRQARQVEVLDLSTIVHDMERMLRRLIGESVALKTSLPGGLPVRVDRTEMEQVVVNLVVNARDAMPKGGRITVETGRSEEPAPSAPGPGGAWATLTVCDTGSGMPPEVKSRLFEPFFTTKPAGKGTGLGLATVYTVVRESEGFITVDSELGKGTTFRVFVPLAAEASAAASPARADAPAPRGTERVLVVEDEDAVRRLAARTLAQQGYEVLVASSGEEAIELARKKGEDIHLVLSDAMMPGMNGAELSRALEEVLPGVPMLFMSGHPDDALKEEGFDFGRIALLKKPLAQGELARRVRERLDARRA